MIQELDRIVITGQRIGSGSFHFGFAVRADSGLCPNRRRPFPKEDRHFKSSFIEVQNLFSSLG